MRLIDGNALYEKTAEWEAQAQRLLLKAPCDELLLVALNERTAFKHEIADAPTVDARATGRWIILKRGIIKDEYGDIIEAICSNCSENGRHDWPFCPECGAKMEAEEDQE